MLMAPLIWPPIAKQTTRVSVSNTNTQERKKTFVFEEVATINDHNRVIQIVEFAFDDSGDGFAADAIDALNSFGVFHGQLGFVV
jgi:hypothetical protein